MDFLSDHAGLVSVIVMFTLMVLSVPVFVSIGIAAIVGFLLLKDPLQVYYDASEIIWESASIHELIAIPLFIFVGVLMEKAGAGKDLFDATKAWVGGIRNSLGVATMFACGMFAAICGSSIATAATIGIVAVPLLLSARYSQEQAGGFVAGGGTLGIIIPPSIPMIIYGVLTETSIGKLFLAGVIPGIILLTCFIIYVMLSRPIVRVSEQVTWAERIAVTRASLPVLLLPVVIIAAIYTGVFTATEVAALAILYVIIVGALQRRLTVKLFFEAGTSATMASSMIFMLIVFGEYLAHFVTFAQLPQAVTAFITEWSVSPLMTITFLMLGYLILGSFLETAAMLLVSVPLFYPIAMSIGMDPIVFGVFICIAMEISQIHPPIGVNLFTIHGITGISLWKLAKGAFPFLIIQTVMLYVVYLLPQLSLWLPQHAFAR